MFEVLAGRVEDLTGIPAQKISPKDFHPVEWGGVLVTLQGRYEQLDEANGHVEPNLWRSVDNDDGFLYAPRRLPEDEGAPDYEKGGFGPITIEGPVLW